MNELEKVKPSEFSIKLLGKKRAVKFGNLALAKIEEKYGSIAGFGEVQKELETRPMATVPWLLSICLRDKEGIEEGTDGILSAMDDSDLTVQEVAEVVMSAINSSLNVGDKKKVTKK